MEIYKDIDNDSNVTHYEIGSTYITILFRGTARLYTYSYYKAGQFHVEKMKILARNGDGLNSYIMRNVRNLYN
ncbi:hypothetical protein [Acinetobacter sp. ANC 4641]|uniref:hypothetical protein n=1 Tax=Acinetobacter sp. ANC 4641 TaxID=2529847 RepID=UPI0010389885|nr:hypothetical protein [Acinetobacter sp. ANC 4641]TCB11041.1 hypothetical protein E0H78_08455 [Acinetobacter sp. ANC 4641]